MHEKKSHLHPRLRQSILFLEIFECGKLERARGFRDAVFLGAVIPCAKDSSVVHIERASARDSLVTGRANSGISSALPLATVSSPVGRTAVLLMPHIVSAGVDNLVIAAVDNMLAGIDSLVIAAINSVWAEMTPFTDLVRTGAASSCISCRTPRRPPGAPARMQ